MSFAGRFRVQASWSLEKAQSNIGAVCILQLHGLHGGTSEPRWDCKPVIDRVH